MPPLEDSTSSASDNDRRRQPSQMSKPSPKLLSLILRAIIMSLLISTFLLFLGVAAFFLLNLFLAGRHLRRRKLPPHGGISNEDIHRLPGFRYDGASQPDSWSECAICLDRIGHGEFCRILPGCGHAFHLKCIDTWLVRAPACPICRARVCAGSGIGADVDVCKQLWTIRA